jgi:hypothetical protein
VSSQPDDPILDEVERKVAIGEIRNAMKTGEFWELTEHAISYARFVYDECRKKKFSRRQAMSFSLHFSRDLFFNTGKSS